MVVDLNEPEPEPFLCKLPEVNPSSLGRTAKVDVRSSLSALSYSETVNTITINKALLQEVSTDLENLKFVLVTLNIVDDAD